MAAVKTTGRIYLTGESYEADKPNELSFLKGDLVTLASELTEDGLHYQGVAADGSMGLIRSSHIIRRGPIQMTPMPWFHSAISRLDAEKLLDRNQDGQFLLRTSQKTKGVYALAVSCGKKINHYLVAMDFTTKKLTINGEKYFDNLPELVQMHMKDPGPLGTVLSHPVVRKGALDFHIDQYSLKKMWGLPKVEVELGSSLGRGEFGEVCMASYRGMQIAGKVIHEEKQNAQATSSFLQEAALLTHLQHSNLVQLVGLVFQGSAMKCILTELMGKGSLQKYLVSRGRSVISPAELLSFAMDVCEGMLYISSEGFIHRDLAARNVLLNSNGQAKISDFGLARKANIHVPHEGGKFPVKWTAPEALKESKFSVKSDVWSYGVLLWEIYSYGRTPYPSVPTTEVLESIEDGLIMDPPDHCPDEIYDLMCICWEIEPNQRPSFSYLQQQLAKTKISQPSRTPTSSPLMTHKHLPSMPDVDQLISGPVAVKAYREAPISRKATLFLGNLIFLGPQGSGKTSLLRSLKGETFRLVEAPSQAIEITESYFVLVENLDWILSESGLMYEDELVRIIVEDLLKHTHSILTRPTRPAAKQPNSPASTCRPPLPPRRRSHSFSETSTNALPRHDTVQLIKADNRLSGSFEVLESGSPEGKRQLGLGPKEASPREHHHHHHIQFKKSVLGKFLTKSFRHHHISRGDHHHRKEKIQRHYSDSVKRSYLTNNGASPSTSSSQASPAYYSPLPERLTDKVKTELNECKGGSLPYEYRARLIDTPGNSSFRVLQSLFLTENSVCVLTFDASKDILSPLVPSLSLKRKPSPEVKENGMDHISPNLKDSYLYHILTDIGDICTQWSGFKSDITIRGPRIVLVGTHSDKASSSVTSRNFEILRDEIKASPYQKYVALVKFIVSNSSIIERSSMDNLKQFLKEVMKKQCRQQVPLKWLRCVRRFQALSKNKKYFMSLTEAEKMVSEICDISRQDPEIAEVINFLHQHQVVMHFPHIHHLKDLVITSPRWFLRQASAIFRAASIDLMTELGPLDLTSDQEALRFTGILTNKLLDYVWREKDSQVNKDEVLTVMHKMDLLCVMASETRPISLSASIDNLKAEVKSKTKQQHHKVIVSSVVIPALVEEDSPTHLLSCPPSYDVDPIMFRFKNHIPNGLFSRVLVRCVQSYPKGFSLYRHAATFEFDPRTILLLTEEDQCICLTLHRPQSSQSLDQSDTDSLLSDSAWVSPDTCMAILMFLRATINDLTRQWTPHLEFDLCVQCECKCPPIPMDVVVDIDAAFEKMSRSVTSRFKASKSKHYVILNDVDSLLQHLSLRCEMGNQIPISASLLCWFGEVPTSSISPSSPSGDIEYVTDEDVNLVLKMLGQSWKDLGQTLGFNQMELERFSLTYGTVSHAGKKMLEEWQTLHNKNATFFALLGALEIIQRRDIADDLVAARMTGDGADL